MQIIYLARIKLIEGVCTLFQNFPPNINPQLFSILAVAVGAAIVDDFDVNEQNSIGNWVILVGQYLLTYAAQQALIEGRIDNYNVNINSRKAKSGGSPYTSSHNKSNQNQRNEVDYLLRALQRMQQEIEKIKETIDENQS